MTIIPQNREFLPDAPAWQSLVVGALVLGACIAGIGTRLLFDLASLWPANALLFGILAFRPETNRPLTWVAAAAAYMLADLLSGSALVPSLWLNGANMAGVACGMLALRLAPPDMLQMRRPTDAILTMLLLALAAGGAAAVGGFAGPILFGLPVTDSLLLWFSTEFVNYAVVFPVVAALALSPRQARRILSRNRSTALRQIAACATLSASIGAMHWLGGPGAIGFVLPGLVWCSVRFRPLAVTLLTLATCTWLLIAGQAGLIPLHADLDSALTASSYRLGVAMIAIVPFAVASLNAAWRTVHAALLHAATHDTLTGLRNRGAFLSAAERLLRGRGEEEPVCLLMIDVDHFKAINDTHGHAAGDEALKAIAACLVRHIRDTDLAGRLGGEEFAIVMPQVNGMTGETIAERIRRAVQAMPVSMGQQAPLSLSISIGVADAIGQEPLRELLSAADSALYAAKHGGRNRVVVVSKAAAAAPAAAMKRAGRP